MTVIVSSARRRARSVRGLRLHVQLSQASPTASTPWARGRSPPEGGEHADGVRRPRPMPRRPGRQRCGGRRCVDLGPQWRTGSEGSPVTMPVVATQAVGLVFFGRPSAGTPRTTPAPRARGPLHLLALTSRRARGTLTTIQSRWGHHETTRAPSRREESHGLPSRLVVTPNISNSSLSHCRLRPRFQGRVTFSHAVLHAVQRSVSVPDRAGAGRRSGDRPKTCSKNAPDH